MHFHEKVWLKGMEGTQFGTSNNMDFFPDFFDHLEEELGKKSVVFFLACLKIPNICHALRILTPQE